MTTTNDSSPSQISRRDLVLASAGTVIAASATSAGLAPAASAAQSGTPHPAAASDPFPVETQLALHELVEHSLAATETPAVLIGIWYPGKGTWLHAGGVGDLTTGAGATIDDHWRIASNTKTFVATVVLQLVDEGLVGLDDPISDYVDGVPDGDKITVRQVIGMTSGVADWVTEPEFAIEYERNPMMTYLPADILAWIRESTPDFAPDAQVHYSNSNYILLGFLIEKVTGQSAARAVTDRLIVPLGLTGTSFPSLPTMPEPYLHGYSNPELGEPLEDVTLSNPMVPWTAGAMVSTIADIKTWVEALANGTVLSPETQAERLQGRALMPGGPSYGLGLIEWNGLIGHNGGIAGYNSWMMSDPETGFTVVLVANRSSEQGGSADAFFYPILNIMVPEKFPPAPAPDEATPAATPTA